MITTNTNERELSSCHFT